MTTMTNLPSMQKKAQELFMEAFYNCPDKNKVDELLTGMKYLLDVPVYKE